MLESIRVKKNSTRRLIGVFVDSAGQLKTGLTVTVRVVRASDDQYLKNDATWTATPSTEYTADEWSAADNPGVYTFDFALPDALDQYLIRLDGGTAAANRYQYAWFEAVAIDESDMHKAKAALVNKQKQAIATGVVTIMDDDGATPLVTLTPSVDDPDNATENILTAS